MAIPRSPPMTPPVMEPAEIVGGLFELAEAEGDFEVLLLAVELEDVAGGTSAVELGDVAEGNCVSFMS